MDIEPIRKQERGRNDEEIEQLIIWGLIAIVGIVFFIPFLLGMMIFLLIYSLKKDRFMPYIAAGGILLLIYLIATGNLLAYLAIFKEMNIPFVPLAIEKMTHKPLDMNLFSYLGIWAFSMVFCLPIGIFAKLHWKKTVKSKQIEIENQKKSAKYLSFRKNRLKFLDKQQVKYRASQERLTFLGYSDFQERVLLDENELNYHMLAVGGTGTGKTTLIASVMEGALRNNKPIIFVDGKGERAAMLDFKKFCEAYGKKVYLFSEFDSYTYNPFKNGTPTEIRDKIMNLFEWSEPYYKNFSSRYLQLIVKIIDAAGLSRELQTIYDLTSIEAVYKVFKDNLKTKEVIDFIEVEVEEEISEPETAVTSENDPFAMFEQPKEPKKLKKTEMKEEKRKVTYLEKDLERLKALFDESFSDERSEANLQGLHNQLGELLESDLGGLFTNSDNEIDLQKITGEGNIVIFSISGSRYRDYIKMLGKLVILDVNSLVAHYQAVGRKPILTIYDEFSAYGNVEIVDIVNKSRSAGFECVISTQTLADIDAVDPTLTSRVLSNCNILASGRVNDSQDAERIASQLGTFSDQEITSQIEKKNPFRKVYAEMGTAKTVEVFRAHPNEIKGLSVGEVFIGRKMKQEQPGVPYTRKVYVRNALNLGGINQGEHASSTKGQASFWKNKGFKTGKKAEAK